jgi:hypothetical protein
MTDEQLKSALLDAMRRRGGLPDLLYQLRDICREMADEQREVIQDEATAGCWERVAKTLHTAAGQSIPLIESS